jgi:hypothetical protein
LKNHFEKVRLFQSRFGALKRRAAFTLPGIGIFVNPLDLNNKDLLRHEFGHILQARKWGLFFFIRYIALQSLRSAKKANKDKTYNHMQCWTEWTANKLAYKYFNCPKDWNFKAYPIEGEYSSQLNLLNQFNITDLQSLTSSKLLTTLHFLCNFHWN